MKDKEKELEEIIGFEITLQDEKNISTLDPKLQKEIEVWSQKNANNILSLQIKKCQVEHVDVNKTEEDFREEYGITEDDDDDIINEAFEAYKNHLKIIKKNEEVCPHFRDCPLFQNDALPKGNKCPLEVMTTTRLRDGIYKELDIKPEDFSDIISANHLVAIENLAQRTLSALSVQAPVVKVITKGKNGITTDTKINDNLAAYQLLMNMRDKINKNLILDRESKMKNKKIESEINEKTIKENLKNRFSNRRFDIDTAELVEAISLEDENSIDING